MGRVQIKKETFDFLKALSKHNNREWFNKHKENYREAHDNIIAFTDALLETMNRHDRIENTSGRESLFRIYRDIRFSKDKTPYNICWHGSFKRATRKLRGGYYFHLSPGNSFLAGGFWNPEPKDLKRIREDIDMHYEDWGKMLRDRTLTRTFGKLVGEQVATVPRGFDKSHPAIDLIRNKQFVLKHPFTDQEVYGSGFVEKANDTFRKMRPFFDYMSEVLTTDANGVPLIED
ncbi:MAG TPA: DUF2461 domain-containing protein [Puia sp.]|nr:DUF2461 domain-containing protein [Puia sp.]